MQKKKAPYVFLGILVVILFFIVGFRAGEQVEHTNKLTSTILSTMPSATAVPSAAPIQYRTYENKTCRIAFLYPGYLQPTDETTKSARLIYKKELIEFSCAAPITPTATDSARTFYTAINPLTRLKTYFYLDKTLEPLLERTLEYTSK